LSVKGLSFLAAAVILLALAPGAIAFGSRSLSLRVYADGYVNVAQTFTADPKASSMQVPLLSNMIYDLVATDQNGSPLSYGFSPGGTNITVYTLGASLVNVNYDTDSLTAKNGTVWTVAFATPYNSTVILPQDSTLNSVSGTPYSINQTDKYPEMTISPGTWRISYGVPFGNGSATTTTTTPTLGSTTSTGGTVTTTSGSTTGASTFSTFALPWEIPAGVITIAVAALLILWWRRRGVKPASNDLRPDDLQVLNFIQEKGGKVLEPEIRMKFALPKTSGWRQIKRLERLGYVKVTKIGSQNQIEIVKDRNQGT
jgi:uncharacterized membrane protein